MKNRVNSSLSRSKELNKFCLPNNSDDLFFCIYPYSMVSSKIKLYLYIFNTLLNSVLCQGLYMCSCALFHGKRDGNRKSNKLFHRSLSIYNSQTAAMESGKTTVENWEKIWINFSNFGSRILHILQSNKLLQRGLFIFPESMPKVKKQH